MALKQVGFLFFILLFPIVMFCSIFPATESFGYSYGLRGKDTLEAVYENVLLLIEKNDYIGIKREAEKIDVPFRNFDNYYGINLKPAFLRAIEQEDGQKLIITLEQLVYFAIREKLYWNRKEELKQAIAARARLRVISQYFGLLKEKIKQHDRKNGSAYRSEIVKLLVDMSATLGSPGVFGYQARPPDLETFTALGKRLEEVFVVIFPHFEEGYRAPIIPH